MTRIACCQYEIENLSDWQAYAAKVETQIIHAKKEGAVCLMLPEYAGVEAACDRFDTEHELFSALQPLIPTYIDLYKKLAQRHHIYIQAGTIIEETTPGKYINRAYFFSPHGSYDYQDKLQLVEAEKSTHLLQHGNHQKIFETSFGKIGIAVCYDSEFPEIIRRLVQQGASIILVPSYTTTVAGYNRVFLACRARAIENQCYLAISYVINTVNISAETEMTHGQAAIVGPVDTGFPNDGIIAQGIMNKPMLVFGDVDLAKLDWIRTHGQVLNYKDTMRCASLENDKIESIRFF
jgi:predicted amidohydrolase